MTSSAFSRLAAGAALPDSEAINLEKLSFLPRKTYKKRQSNDEKRIRFNNNREDGDVKCASHGCHCLETARPSRRQVRQRLKSLAMKWDKPLPVRPDLQDVA